MSQSKKVLQRIFGGLCLFLLLNGSSPVAVGQEAVIEVLPERTAVSIADPFWLEIVVTAAKEARVQFPPVGQRIGSFDVLDQNDRFGIIAPDNGNRRRWTRRLLLETIETGEIEIPPIECLVSVEGQASNRLISVPIVIQVASVLEPESPLDKFNDIRDVVDVEIPEQPNRGWIIWSFAGAAAMAGIIALGIAIGRRKKWTTPADLAIQQLHGRPPLPVTDLERVLRLFLEREFEFPATTCSADQIDEQLAHYRTDEANRQKVRSLLKKSELVKFAGESMGDDEILRSNHSTLDLIRKLSLLQKGEK